ncbi:MAG: DUF721 domain-containing protein [Pyrinomonadaceae bacterium]|nr:DUF721 domain-containing protein [Pyrinomonadaceae bacterium]
MNAIFPALPDILDEFGENAAVRDALIFAAWKRTAGENLSGHTVPVTYARKRLTIAVADNMWKRHLEILSDQMIYKINSELQREAVIFIEFVIDAKTVEADRTEKSKNDLPDEEFRRRALEQLSPKLRRAANAIKDENLRYKFLLAAGGCLERKAAMKEKED